MKPKVLHQEAMNNSFRAKQAQEEGYFSEAFDLYQKAAELESKVAEFYFDKPELEPTRSVLIRSAAFLNLKAGLIEEAQKFIFFGLLHIEDEHIKIQLNNALELAVSLRSVSPTIATKEFNYINLLRQRSLHYVLEPTNLSFGHSVSLEMIKDFSENYLKSLKSYALTLFKRISKTSKDVEDQLKKEVEKFINPLITSSAYGSFKFSIANDFLQREGESKELISLKANIISNYHNEIFTNPLTDKEIEIIKSTYSDIEINEIFRPLSKIKGSNTPYKIGYYDVDDYNKKFTDRIVNKQKKKLLPIISISREDIGELETSIIHKRSSEAGKVHKKTIFREQLKSYEFDVKSNIIEPHNKPPIILNEDILLNVYFNSDTGFNILFEDFRIEYSDIEYDKTLKGFYDKFYIKLYYLRMKKEKTDEEQRDWDSIIKLIGNLDAFGSDE